MNTFKRCIIRINTDTDIKEYTCTCNGGHGFNLSKLPDIFQPGWLAAHPYDTHDLVMSGTVLDSSILRRLKNGRIFPKYCMTAYSKDQRQQRN